MSKLTKISVLLAVFFGLDKIVALVRQVIIARQFGFSAELDAFNVANNLPDLLYAMISGGALAIALIPVLSEVMSKDGRKALWDLFSRVANIAFVATAILSVLIAIFAPNLVGWRLGIAPGFGPEQRLTVVNLMRLNLFATLIFSISGLVMAGLQANQHFLFPAMSPILYNVGQIIGAIFFAPIWGVYGLVYGVILGALLHLFIQTPALIKYQFSWIPSFGWHDYYVQKVLKLMGPRVISIFLVQLVFIVRDNLASHLQEGAVSALSYGWMIQQLPETLIGTAIGTALLPTLSEMVAAKEDTRFSETIEKAFRVLIAVTIPVAVIAGLGLKPFVELVFGLSMAQTDLLLWVTRGYLVGLMGHCLLETAARAFYARQNAIIPMLGAVLNLAIYITLGSFLYQTLGAAGVSLTDSIAFTAQAVVLIIILVKYYKFDLSVGLVPLKSLLAGAAAALVMLLFSQFAGNVIHLPEIVLMSISILLGVLVSVPLIWKEARLILKL